MIFKWYVLTSVILMNIVCSGSNADSRIPDDLFEKLSTDNSSKPINVVCLGDSVTGIYYHTGSRRAYSSLIESGLRELYPKISINVINEGVSGIPSGTGLQRMPKILENYKPQIVTIMFGLNDVALHVPIETYKNNLSRMVDLAKQYGAAVIVCTPNSVIETSRRPRKVVAEYAQAAREVAKEKAVRLADVFAAFEQVRNLDSKQWYLLFSEGEIHPNMLGHQIIANEILSSIAGTKKGTNNIILSEIPIQRTLNKIKTGKPVKVLAMEPYDKIFEKVFLRFYPDVKLEMKPLPAKVESIAQLNKDFKKHRGNSDLIIIAVPQSGYCPKWIDNAKAINNFLNNILVYDSTKLSEQCDIIGISGNLLAPDKPQTDNELLFLNLMKSRDIITLTRSSKNSGNAFDIISEWFANQTKMNQQKPIVQKLP